VGTRRLLCQRSQQRSGLFPHGTSQCGSSLAIPLRVSDEWHRCTYHEPLVDVTTCHGGPTHSALSTNTFLHRPHLETLLQVTCPTGAKFVSSPFFPHHTCGPVFNSISRISRISDLRPIPSVKVLADLNEGSRPHRPANHCPNILRREPLVRSF